MANEVERERERERAFLDRQVELDKTLKRIQEREKRIQEQEKRIQEQEEEYRLYRIRVKRYHKISDIGWVLLVVFFIYHTNNIYDYYSAIRALT